MHCRTFVLSCLELVAWHDYFFWTYCINTLASRAADDWRRAVSPPHNKRSYKHEQELAFTNYTNYTWLRAHPGTSSEASQACSASVVSRPSAWFRCGYLPNFLSTSV